MAHKLAFAGDAIRGDMVEVMEFPHLANKYGVMGVPKVVINEDTAFEGALPEDMYMTHVMAAVKS